MKIRYGFVSNSSSSSFLIYGTIVSHQKMKEVALKNGKEVYDFGWGSGLFMTQPCEDDWCVGLSYAEIKDDETGLEFKERVKKALAENGFSVTSLGTLSEAWYDG